jgi:hypothetical protein
MEVLKVSIHQLKTHQSVRNAVGCHFTIFIVLTATNFLFTSIPLLPETYFGYLFSLHHLGYMHFPLESTYQEGNSGPYQSTWAEKNTATNVRSTFSRHFPTIIVVTVSNNRSRGFHNVQMQINIITISSSTFQHQAFQNPSQILKKKKSIYCSMPFHTCVSNC